MRTQLLALALSLGILSGCSGAGAPTPSTSPPSITATENQPQSPEASVRKITDMAGRTVTIPNEIHTVFSADPVAAIYLYTLVPDRLLGWNYALNPQERSVILEEYHSLPNYGMGDAINYEAVISASPSIALSVSAINDGSIAQADKLSQSLGIPVVVVSDSLEDTPDVYRFMGQLFHTVEEAEQLALYTERTFETVSSIQIPEEEKVSVYYGNKEDSLETIPAGSPHSQIIAMVNGMNVANLDLGEGARMRISLEQLLTWDPDVIIVNGEPKTDISGDSAANTILNNSDFATLTAVQNQRVFGVPNVPFSWIERPPGPNRIIGVRWLAQKLYPEQFDYDLDEEVKTFFSLFYHTQLTDERLAEIYAGF